MMTEEQNILVFGGGKGLWEGGTSVLACGMLILARPKSPGGLSRTLHVTWSVGCSVRFIAQAWLYLNVTCCSWAFQPYCCVCSKTPNQAKGWVGRGILLPSRYAAQREVLFDDFREGGGPSGTGSVLTSLLFPWASLMQLLHVESEQLWLTWLC